MALVILSSAETRQNLAGVEEYLGKYDDAERDYRKALEDERKTLGPNHRSVSTTLNNYGQMLFKLGRLEEADSMLRAALAINRKLFAENTDGISANLSNLALVVRERGDFEGAEKLLEEALAIDTKLYGPNHFNVGFDLNEIAVVLRLRGNPDSAIKVLQPSLAMSRQISGVDAKATLAIDVNLGRALDEAHWYQESEKLLRYALSKLDTNNADTRLLIVPGRIGLGRVLVDTHCATEAIPVLKSAVEMSRVRQGPDHWRTGEADIVLARALMDVGNFHDAREPLENGKRVLGKQLKAHPLLAAEAKAADARFGRSCKSDCS